MWNAIFGSTETSAPTALEVTFSLNGKSVTVGDNIAEGTTLNTYIRDHAKLKGTKFMCTEGGCGACIVSATAEHPVTKVKETHSINSCLVPVFACHGWEITTVEGIGNKRDKYHPAQANLAQFNGTQCGFCSPGMVMNMYSLMADGKKPTMAEVENAFGGNICRCTGYRPIMDAFKALASDASPAMKKKCEDIEDLYKICSKTGKACAGSCTKGEKVETKSVKLPAANWYKVATLTELFEVIGTLDGKVYQLSAGNTAEGVYRHYNRQFDARIDVKDVPELRTVDSASGYTVGANVTLTEAIAAFNKQAAAVGYSYMSDLAKHLDKVANTPVRNVGTLAGNLVMKKDNPEFPSDVFVMLETAGATLNILTAPTTSQNINLLDFLTMDLSKKVILNITFPAFEANHRFRTFKIMPREQNAHAYVSAGFKIKVADTTNWNINELPRIVFCGIKPDFHHATNTENYLMGKNLLDDATIQGAIGALAGEIVPDHDNPADASPEFRKLVAQGVFYKFLLGLDPTKVSEKKKSGADNLVRPETYSQQDYEKDPSLYPLNEPIPKLEAIAQTSGEAEYINDIPERPGELHGALVLSTQGTGTIEKIDDSQALAVPGVVAFFKASDILGKNSFTPKALGFVEDEEIFCSGKIQYAGQVVGMIVAESRLVARQASGLVQISYTKGEKPILSVQEVMKATVGRTKQAEKASEVKNKNSSQEKGKALVKIDGNFEIQAQYHMHMETHTCIVVPTEDGYDVFSATQWMDHVQEVISQCLGVKESSISVTVRRLGGAYGGKISRPALVAGACAVAAHKLGKPVRVVMSLRENMEAMGKRIPYVHKYEVTVDGETGKIQSLNGEVLMDKGCSFNDSPLSALETSIQNCYVSDNFTLDAKMIRTDTACNTWCRGPGSTEGVAFIEEVMEHIARVTKLDPLQVRLNNMPQINNPLLNMIDDLKATATYDTRKAAIETFNASNRWKKRGIALVPMQYRFEGAGNYSALVAINHGDGSVSIGHGGIEMGQGLNTKVAQVAAYTLKIALDKISIKPSNNLAAANSTVTGGSVGSEAVSYGAMMACKKLLERLEPVRVSLGNPTWEELVQKAFEQNVDLIATHMFATGQGISPYNIWGASIAEVEVDILTGERQVLRVDIIEDVGQSLSPMIDVGQIEGAFVMGMGYWLSEELKYDANTARLLNTRTWNYKVPGVRDIPANFRISFRKNAANPLGVLNSKATGEPALNMSIVCLFAVRDALHSARLDAGNIESYYEMKLPASVEHVAMASLTDPTQFTLA